MTKTAPQALRDAAAHIERYGWTKHRLYDTSSGNTDRSTAPSCGIGALAAELGMAETVDGYEFMGYGNTIGPKGAVFSAAREAVARVVADRTQTSAAGLPYFNDRVATRAEEVCDVLRQAATMLETNTLPQRPERPQVAPWLPNSLWTKTAWTEPAGDPLSAYQEMIKESLAQTVDAMAKFAITIGGFQVDLESFQAVLLGTASAEQAAAEAHAILDTVEQGPITRDDVVDAPTVSEVEVIDAAEALIAALAEHDELSEASGTERLPALAGAAA